MRLPLVFESGSSVHQRNRGSTYKDMSRPTSGISFAGLGSFDEVRRGFEFSSDPPASNSRRVPHRRRESVFSIASVSSYGHVINSGSTDPFDYGLPSLRERPSSEDMSNISMSMTPLRSSVTSLVVVLMVIPQASIFAHLLLLLVRVVVVAMNPTCLCLPKLL